MLSGSRTSVANHRHHERQNLTKVEIAPTLSKAVTAGECGRLLLFTIGGRILCHGNANGTSGSRVGPEQTATKFGQSRLLQGPLMEEPEKLLEACSVCSRHSTAAQRPGELRVRAFMGSPTRGIESHRRCLFHQSSCAREEIISWKEQT